VTVRIRFFAIMTQQAGCGGTTLDLPAQTALRDVQPLLQKRFPDLRWPPGTMLAVNQEYAAPNRTLHDGDEVAIIPPVSGG
jgi:molybdopterin converting factor subunit 1